jgi:hypothetical protein
MSRPIAASATSSGGCAGGSAGERFSGRAAALDRGLFVAALLAAVFLAGAVFFAGWAIAVPLVTEQ